MDEAINLSCKFSLPICFNILFPAKILNGVAPPTAPGQRRAAGWRFQRSFDAFYPGKTPPHSDHSTTLTKAPPQGAGRRWPGALRAWFRAGSAGTNDLRRAGFTPPPPNRTWPDLRSNLPDLNPVFTVRSVNHAIRAVATDAIPTKYRRDTAWVFCPLTLFPGALCESR